MREDAELAQLADEACVAHLRAKCKRLDGEGCSASLASLPLEPSTSPARLPAVAARHLGLHTPPRLKAPTRGSNVRMGASLLRCRAANSASR